MTGWKGTPGPWKAATDHGCKSIKGPSRGKRQPRDEVACTVGLFDDDKDTANAKGMAAVPELVEALVKVRNWRNNHGLGSAVEVPLREWELVEALAERALAKAGVKL